MKQYELQHQPVTTLTLRTNVRDLATSWCCQVMVQSWWTDCKNATSRRIQRIQNLFKSKYVTLSSILIVRNKCLSHACYMFLPLLASHGKYRPSFWPQQLKVPRSLHVCTVTFLPSHSPHIPIISSDIFRYLQISSDRSRRWGDGFGWDSKDHHFVQLFRFPGGAKCQAVRNSWKFRREKRRFKTLPEGVPSTRGPRPVSGLDNLATFGEIAHLQEFIYIYVYVYVYDYICIYMYIYVYVYMYICIYVYMYILYMYMCICVYVYMCICVYVYMCICVCVYMYICVYVYMYICIYVYMYIVYICIYLYMYICIYVYMYICIYVYMYICIYVYMYICIYVYMYICIYVYMYICICIYIYVYMYIYI